MQAEVDHAAYRRRRAIECTVGALEELCSVATRDEKFDPLSWHSYTSAYSIYPSADLNRRCHMERPQFVPPIARRVDPEPPARRKLISPWSVQMSALVVSFEQTKRSN